MKKIEFNTWKRKATYENFIKYTNPVFSMGTRLDVTRLLSYCEKEGKSFFAAFLYFVTMCANEIEEFKIRISDDGIVLYDYVRPSYIVILENQELVTCMSEYDESFEGFYKGVRCDIENVIKNNRPSFNEKIFYDCLYISCVPWTDFTSVSNPYNFDDKKVTSIPRITWGKYVKKAGGQADMARDVSAHHGLMDGRHISCFYEKLQNALNNPEVFIKRGN